MSSNRMKIFIGQALTLDITIRQPMTAREYVVDQSTLAANNGGWCFMHDGSSAWRFGDVTAVQELPRVDPQPQGTPGRGM